MMRLPYRALSSQCNDSGPRFPAQIAFKVIDETEKQQIMDILESYEEHTKSSPLTLLPAFYSIITMWAPRKPRVTILVTKNMFHTLDTINEVRITCETARACRSICDIAGCLQSARPSIRNARSSNLAGVGWAARSPKQQRHSKPSKRSSRAAVEPASTKDLRRVCGGMRWHRISASRFPVCLSLPRLWT